MKKTLFTIAIAAIGFQCFATGLLPQNTTQSGVLQFTTNGASPLIITNTFNPSYTYTPAMQFFLVSGVTNALPLTNTILTVSNFALSLATPTNCSIAWTAIEPSPRVNFGVLTNPPVSGSTLVTNTFTSAYASIPSVVVSGSILASATNGVPVVSSVTTTGFVLSYGANTNQTVYWQAIGQAYAPGPSPNPVSY